VAVGLTKMANPLAVAITDAVIRRLADEQTYNRGLDYFTHGHVESLKELSDGAAAVVRDEQDFPVMLTADEGVLDFSCGCPEGADGTFCKHCVAAALAWLDRGDKPKKSSRGGKAKQVTLAEAAKLLRAEEKEELVRLLLGWAKDNARLRETLIIYAARRSGPDVGAAAVGRAFEKAARVRGYKSYHEARGWARDVGKAIDAIEHLLQDGQAGAVIELCESALDTLVGAIESVDDSDGHFGVLRDRLQDIHLQACQEARPDPVVLAERLFYAEMRTGFDVFYRAVRDYAEILGTKGLQAYRKLAEAEWSKVPARAASDKNSRWGEHFRITSIMESLAETSGDVEQIVAVLSKDLSNGYNYLQIAEEYREAGLHDKALLWAENGSRAFPENTDRRLRDFLAAEYHRRNRHADAVQLVWEAFCERPFLETYQTLQRHAQMAGAWPEWRERALAELRQRIAKSKEHARGPSWQRAGVDHSVLVEIFIYEENPDQAWREAREGGCSDGLWLRLAATREETHPADAAPIYLKYGEAGVHSIRDGRYEDSVSLLVRAAALMQRLGQGAEFVRRLEALRTTYKAKRNFIKLVEQNRKSLYLS